VSWAASATATAYTLEEDTNAAFPAPVVAYTGAATTFNVTGKANGTYYYRVMASNASGNSGWTVGGNGCTVLLPPLPPASITVPTNSSTGNYTVNWAASATATAYTLEEDTNAAFPAPVVAYTGAATTFNVTGKASGTYYYRVLATNASGSSGWMTGANGCIVLLPPTAPASITVPANSTTGNYTVSWAASATAVTYTLEEDTVATFPAPSVAYTGAATSFNVTGKANGTYYYRVLATNTSGSSGWTVGGNGCTVLLVPPAPASITVPANSATGNFTVSWAASATATSYTLEEDSTATFTAPSVAYTGAATTFNVTGKPGGTWYYRVLATNASGSSGWTAGANGCTVLLPPAPPASITVPTNSTTGNYTVSWAASVSAVSYTLEEDTVATFASATVVYGGANTTFNVTGKTNGIYYYRVQASNVSGNSGWTVGGNGCTVLFPPAAPASITVPANSTTGNYTVSWSSSPTASFYDLQEDTSLAFTSPTLVYTGANLSFNVTGRTDGTYYYRVRAANPSGTSAWTAGAIGCVVLLPPQAPPSITVPAGSITGNYTVSWDASTTATSYDLEEDTSATFASAVVAYSGANLTFDVTGKADGTYYYRVRAVNSSGSSGWVEGANGCVVTRTPDLQAQSVSVVAAPVTVHPGESIDVQHTILNAGGLAGTVSFSILISPDAVITIADALALSDTTPSIDPGNSDTATVTWVVPLSFPTGDFYVGLYIDATNLAATANPDLSVVPVPPPPSEKAGCGCSPVGGVATPADLFGMLLPFFLWALVVFGARRRRGRCG
jgi:predicted phage tail protein